MVIYIAEGWGSTCIKEAQKSVVVIQCFSIPGNTQDRNREFRNPKIAAPHEKQVINWRSECTLTVLKIISFQSLSYA